MFGKNQIARHCVFAAFVIFSSAQLVGSAAPSRSEVFQQVWQTVKDKFFDPKLRGLDWEAMKQRYGKEAEAADSAEEFASAVNRMLAELKTSHTE